MLCMSGWNINTCMCFVLAYGNIHNHCIPWLYIELLEHYSEVMQGFNTCIQI